jgi:hypothetical protein
MRIRRQGISDLTHSTPQILGQARSPHLRPARLESKRIMPDRERYGERQIGRYASSDRPVELWLRDADRSAVRDGSGAARVIATGISKRPVREDDERVPLVSEVAVPAAFTGERVFENARETISVAIGDLELDERSGRWLSCRDIADARPRDLRHRYGHRSVAMGAQRRRGLRGMVPSCGPVSICAQSTRNCSPKSTLRVSHPLGNDRPSPPAFGTLSHRSADHRSPWSMGGRLAPFADMSGTSSKDGPPHKRRCVRHTRSTPRRVFPLVCRALCTRTRARSHPAGSLGRAGPIRTCSTCEVAPLPTRT